MIAFSYIVTPSTINNLVILASMYKVLQLLLTLTLRDSPVLYLEPYFDLRAEEEGRVN